MKRAVLPFLLVSIALFLGDTGMAFAQSGVFSKAPSTDLANAWLDLLFRGTELPDQVTRNAPNLSLIAEALHHALGIYSTGVLVIAAVILFYNLAVMVLETAHYGVPMGRKSAQIWGPIRLVLAIGFLVPVSGGLNAGQYIVAWMAEQGSSLGSHVWRVSAETMHNSFSGIAMPQSPNVASYVAGALEMEMCRSLYRKLYISYSANKAVAASGNIDTIEKIQRTRFAEETWQYTDHLQSSIPMCGAYRFASHTTTTDETRVVSNIERLSNDLATFSRTETDKVIAEVQPIAEDNLPIFLGQAAGPGVGNSIKGIIDEYQSAVDEKLHDVISNDPQLINETMTASAEAGWITAGGFMLQLARLQEMYGTLAAHTLPAVQAPVFAANYSRHSLADAIATDPLLVTLASEDLVPLKTFQAQMARSMQLAHDWIYNNQLLEVPVLLANPFDLASQMGAGDDPEAISSLFGHVLNDAATTYGVWNQPINKQLPANSILATDGQSLLALPSSLQNPITALAEFGRRQVALGNYLFGVAGPDVAPAGTLAYSLLLGLVGFCFMASGLALMFIVPLLPFFRFFVGVITWLLSVLEAVIAIPIVALAHVNIGGEGLSGGTARQAYLLWLNIFIRPALTLFGFVAGLLLFSFAIIFLGMVFFQLSRFAAPANAELFVTLNVAITFLYTVLACAAANIAFKGITFLPELAFNWLGGLVAVGQGGDERGATTHTGQGPSGSLTPMGSSSMLAQQGLQGAMGGLVTKGYASAATRAQGLKMALFPNYRDHYVPPSSKDASTSAPSGKVDVVVSNNTTVSVQSGPGTLTGYSTGIYGQKPDRREDKQKRDSLSYVGKKTGDNEGSMEDPQARATEGKAPTTDDAPQ